MPAMSCTAPVQTYAVLQMTWDATQTRGQHTHICTDNNMKCLLRPANYATCKSLSLNVTSKMYNVQNVTLCIHNTFEINICNH